MWKAELQIFASQGRAVERKQNSRSLAVSAVRNSGTELHIFGSQGRAEVWKRNFTFLAVKAERKCGAELQIFCSKDREEAELQIFDSPVKLDVRKQNSSSPTGPYPTVLKNNSTDCYIDGHCEDYVCLKHMTCNARDKVSMHLQGLWVILV